MVDARPLLAHLKAEPRYARWTRAQAWLIYGPVKWLLLLDALRQELVLHWLYAQLLLAWSFALDVDHGSWPTDTLASASSRPQLHAKCDPAIRVAMATSLVQRGKTLSAFRIAPVAKALGKSLVAHRIKTDRAMGGGWGHYWLVARRLFSGCKHVALVVHASPHGGRSRLLARCMESRSNTCAWGPLQAKSRTVCF